MHYNIFQKLLTRANINVTISVSNETECTCLDNILNAKRYARQLTETALFQGVDVERVRAWLLEETITVSAYPSGAFLLTRDSTTHYLGVILRGSADVIRTGEDGLMHMSTLQRNDLFGAASLFGGELRYVIDVVCRTDVRVLRISEAQLLRLMRQEESVLTNFLHYLNSRIRFLNRRLDALSKNSVSAKLLAFLESEAVNGVYAAPSYTILSESLCISRATLYRALDTLITEGKVCRDGKKIIIQRKEEEPEL